MLAVVDESGAEADSAGCWRRKMMNSVEECLLVLFSFVAECKRMPREQEKTLLDKQAGNQENGKILESRDVTN